MIKKIITSTLAIAMTASMAITAMAELKPYGAVTTHYGMFSDTAKTTAYESDGSTAADTKAPATYFEFLYKSQFGVAFSEEDFTAKAFVSTRTDHTNGSKVHAETTYKATDAVSVTLGNVLTPAGSLGFTMGAGYLNYDTGWISDLDVIHGAVAYIEHPGVIVKYAINPAMAAYFGMYDKNTLFNGWVGLPEYVAIATAAAMSGCTNCGNAQVPTEGSGMSLSFQGMLSKQLLVGAGYLTSTHDDHNGLPTDNASAMNLTGMYFMGNMTIAADYATTTRGYFTGIENDAGDAIDGKMVMSDLGILLKMKGIGPGELGIKVASATMKVETAAFGDLEAASYGQTNTHLHYEFPACGKSCKIGFVYDSLTRKAENDGAEAETQTWIGGSMKAMF